MNNIPMFRLVESEKDIDEFLEVYSKYKNELIFRGQSNAEWELIPSIYRQGIPEILMNKYKFPFDGKHGTIAEKFYFAEIAQYFEYYVHKNQKGHIVPRYDDFDFSFDVIEYIYYKTKRTYHNLIVPEEKLIPFEHYCQHHGLYTRLLDWSYNIYVALCFAAEKSQNHDAKMFSLYILYPSMTFFRKFLGFYIPDYSISLNAHNQLSVLTYIRECYRNENEWIKMYNQSSYEKLFNELFQTKDNFPEETRKAISRDKLFLKFNIPVQFREYIIQKCKENGFVYNNLFR